MLDPDALHQTRFNTPGVIPDGRGVMLGKLGALLFPSVDALVGYIRIFGEEASLDELLPKLRIDEVRATTGGRQFLALLPLRRPCPGLRGKPVTSPLLTKVFAHNASKQGWPMYMLPSCLT
jgi:hypothetical protein